MAARTQEQKENRAARRRQVAREMRVLLKRVSALDDTSRAECIVCRAAKGERHADDCVIGEVRRWLAVHKDGDGS